MLTGMSLGVRVFRIDHHSFWYDEYATFSIAKQTWGTLFGPLMRIETNPPGYYILQKLWLPFGESRTALRMLPAIAGSLATPILFLLTRRLAGRPEAWIAAILFITAPLHLVYAREARGYSILTLGALVAVLATITLLQQGDSTPTKAKHARRTAYERLTAVALAGSITTCLFMHNTAIFIPFLLSVFVAIDAIAARRQARRNLPASAQASTPMPGSRHLMVIGLIVAGCLPFAIWVPTMYAQATTESGAPIHWIPELSLDQVYTTILSTYPYPKLSKPLVYLIVAIGSALGFLRSKRLGLVLLVCLVGQPLLVLAASLVVPMFIPRILLWPSALVFIPIAIVIARLGTPARILAVISLTALHAMAARPEFPRHRVPDAWIEAAAVVAASEAGARDTPPDLLPVLICSPRAMALRIQFAARDFPIPPDRWIGVDSRNAPLNPIDSLLPGVGIPWRDFPSALERHRVAWIITDDPDASDVLEADRIEVHFEELRQRGWWIDLHSTTSDASVWRAVRAPALTEGGQRLDEIGTQSPP